MNREDYKALRAAFRQAANQDWNRAELCAFLTGSVYAFTLPLPLAPFVPLDLSEQDATTEHRTALFDIWRDPRGWWGIRGRWHGDRSEWVRIDGPWREGAGPFSDIDVRKELQLLDWDPRMGRARA